MAIPIKFDLAMELVFLRRLRQVWPSTLWARSKFVGISKKRSTGQDIADAGAHEIKTHHFRLAKQTSVRKFDILMFDKLPKNAKPKFGMQNLTIAELSGAPS